MADGLTFYIKQSAKDAIKKKFQKPLKKICKEDGPALRSIAEQYGLCANVFVPRSKDNVPHHLQEFSVTTRGRVIWRRRNTEGEDIAGQLYYGPMKGHFHKRPGISLSPGGVHKISPMGGPWDEQMKNDTPTWTKFTKATQRIIKEYLKNG